MKYTRFQITGIKLITESKEDELFSAWDEMKKRLNEAGFAVVGKNTSVTVIGEREDRKQEGGR